MKKLLLVGAFLFISASIFSLDFSTGNDKGTVTIFRSGTVIGSAIAIEVMINQSVMVKLKRLEAVELTLNPGVYLIHIQTEKVWGTQLPEFDVYKFEVKSGEDSYYRITPKRTYHFDKVDQLEENISGEYVENLYWVRGDE